MPGLDPAARDVYADACRTAEQACRHLGLGGAETAVICRPERFCEVTIPVSTGGGLCTFAGYRSTHSRALGPAKGGIRFHPSVTGSEVAALGLWMTVKTALLELPLGGGKGGVACDPRLLSPAELEACSRGFVRALHRELGADRDVPAPDVYTDERVMAWMLDEYEQLQGAAEPASFTGKPLLLGGSALRGEATGRGCALAALAALRAGGQAAEGARFAVQGYGNAGSVAAKMLHAAGLRLVAASDSRGAVVSRGGLHPEELAAYKQAYGSVAGFPSGSPMDPSELLRLPVELLIPAALEGVIDGQSANDVRAGLIVEAANGPVTADGDLVLDRRGVPVVPDVLANAGGVVVSYFEWAQNRAGWYWTPGEVASRLEQRMETAFARVAAAARDHGHSMRQAAYVLALGRVADALRLRGRLGPPVPRKGARDRRNGAYAAALPSHGL